MASGVDASLPWGLGKASLSACEREGVFFSPAVFDWSCSDVLEFIWSLPISSCASARGSTFDMAFFCFCDTCRGFATAKRLLGFYYGLDGVLSYSLLSSSGSLALLVACGFKSVDFPFAAGCRFELALSADWSAAESLDCSDWRL